MARWVLMLAVAGCALAASGAFTGTAPPRWLRPPAVPLVVHDPYFSAWSFADRLTDGWPKHWTGHNQAMAGMIRVDGKTWRFMGLPGRDVPAAPQSQLRVHPTRTVYWFRIGGIMLRLTFLTPALPGDLEVLARPVTYLIFDVWADDRKAHDVALYFDASAEWATSADDQKVVWKRLDIGGQHPLDAMCIGSADQPVLAKKGDNLRIDWGHLYLAAPKGHGARMAIVAADRAREAFAASGAAPKADDTRMPRAANDEWPAMACVFPLGKVTAGGATRILLLAYDDLHSIEYFGKKLRPWWRRKGMDAAQLLAAALRDFGPLGTRCLDFDNAFWREARKLGGENYARLCALAFRQCLGAHKLVADADGTPLYFSKECFSNGCIATVDVSYPSSPFFLRYSTTLLKGQLIPIFAYARSGAWKFPFAPHDLGTYPKANGQVYGGNRLERQMPVEESGNMLLMTAGVCKAEGKADLAAKHWHTLTQWAAYLRESGLDPANQLCTADMFGHMAHNADLSLKAINALAAYAMMARMLGKKDVADTYRRVAEDFAARWVKMAADDGHTRLAFDRPGTWGMKHNLIWDRILGLRLFPSAVGDREVALYLHKQRRFGLPCDSRTTTCLIDWAVWCACLARNADDFAELLAPLYRYADETPSRVPLSDWFHTTTGRRRGFQARSVVGGIFMRFLAPAQPGAPRVPRRTPQQDRWLLRTAQDKPPTWRYTLKNPGERFADPDLDDSAWKTGPSGFGTPTTPGSIVGTQWNTKDIWLRIPVSYDGKPFKQAAVSIHHDEDATIYLNGQKILKATWYVTEYQLLDATETIRKALRKGRNLLAVHCHQTTGGQYIDLGILLDPKEPVAAQPKPFKLPTLKPLFDFPVRDTSVCLGRDGAYYLTGTTGHPTWWKTNDGVRVWRSPDLKTWTLLGLVWSLDRHGTWEKKPRTGRRALWAPDIHYFKDTYWITYCMNFRGTGILKSTTGKPEGPYQSISPGGPLTDEIDASLFQDDDGTVYFVYQNGKIARMNADMSALAEKPRLLKPSNHRHVGFEGAFLAKIQGRYHLVCADFDRRRNYHCYIASAKTLYGPYGPRYLAIPHAGHNMLFRDKAGRWWATFFGNDPRAPFRERPAILRITLTPDGRIRPLMP